MKLLLSPYTIEQRYRARIEGLKKDLEFYSDENIEMVEELLVLCIEYIKDYEGEEFSAAYMNLEQGLFWLQKYYYED